MFLDIMKKFVVVFLFAVLLFEDGISLMPPHPKSSYDEVQYLYKRATGFKRKFVSHNGSVFGSKPSNVLTIEVAGTVSTSDVALNKAVKTISLMVKHMPDRIFDSVANHSHGVGIFTRTESPTVYPEFSYHADRPECSGHKCDGNCSNTCTHDGRKYSEIWGVANYRAVVLDDNVLCNTNDPYRQKENVLIHEFGHIIMLFSPSDVTNKINSAFKAAIKNKTWQDGHGTKSSCEYWAEATSAYFGATQTDTTAVGMNMCFSSLICPNEHLMRVNIHIKDPALSDVLNYVYSNGNSSVTSGLKTCM